MNYAKIDINGKTYPLALTARVIDNLQAINGDEWNNELDRILNSNRMRDMFWLLAQMMDAGRRSCKYEGIETPMPPDVEELLDTVHLNRMTEMAESIKLAVSMSASPDVTLEDDGKNLKATDPTA